MKQPHCSLTCVHEQLYAHLIPFLCHMQFVFLTTLNGSREGERERESEREREREKERERERKRESKRVRE